MAIAGTDHGDERRLDVRLVHGGNFRGAAAVAGIRRGAIADEAAQLKLADA